MTPAETQPEYRVYTKRAASQGGSMRLIATVYSEADARRIASDTAIKGEWAKITIRDVTAASRWD